MECRSLRVTVNNGNLGWLHWLNQVLNYEAFSTSFRTYKDERVSLIQPRLDQCNVFLNVSCLNNRGIFRILQIINSNFRLHFLYKCHPALSFFIKVVIQYISCIRNSFSCNVQNQISKLSSQLQWEIASQSFDYCFSELGLTLNIVHVTKCIFNYSYLSGFNYK